MYMCASSNYLPELIASDHTQRTLHPPDRRVAHMGYPPTDTRSNGPSTSASTRPQPRPSQRGAGVASASTRGASTPKAGPPPLPSSHGRLVVQSKPAAVARKQRETTYQYTVHDSSQPTLPRFTDTRPGCAQPSPFRATTTTGTYSHPRASPDGMVRRVGESGRVGRIDRYAAGARVRYQRSAASAGCHRPASGERWRRSAPSPSPSPS